MIEEKISLGIDPKSANETESRQIELVMNLLKNRGGLSFKKICKIMPHFYGNEKLQSDEKKLQRDIEELKELGFSIKYYKSYLENPSNIGNVYKIESNNTEIQFSQEELKFLSDLIFEKSQLQNSEVLFSISQKIFSGDLTHFPKMKKDSMVEEVNLNDEKEANKIKFNKIIQAIQNKVPLKIHYNKLVDKKIEVREIEPLEIVKKGLVDFYIIAYDRERKGFRKFIFQKIEKLTSLTGSFFHSRKPTNAEKNFHPLGFHVHESIELNIYIEPDYIWRFKDFLSDYPYKEEKSKFYFSTTNLQALCGFFYSHSEIPVKTDSDKFIFEFKNYISEIKKNYNNSEKFL
ncbi:MAG: WYL domain-containing protein [Leptospiraceae bacterium]|nr:WYL domain-containing protein [Leptospiraceae bacterium]MCK6379980.1 WYL domain-containing protein [Leptospiraceae bacterium]NUM40059.1 WYL domain-containing protein [Leptospiraceae bacterium]